METDSHTKKYIKLQDLEVYRLARQLSKLAWQIYEKQSWQLKKVIGDQFITATDSAGANIAEGYSRFHYLDKIKFYYNARASLVESCDHWLELLHERKLIDGDINKRFKAIADTLSLKLNNFIKATYNQKNKQ